MLIFNDLIKLLQKVKSEEDLSQELYEEMIGATNIIGMITLMHQHGFNSLEALTEHRSIINGNIDAIIEDIE